MTGSFHISLFEGTLHVNKIRVIQNRKHYARGLPFPVYQQTDFTLKRVVVSHLHDTVVRFRTGVKFSPHTTTGVNSRWGDSRGMIFCGGTYHVNKCRAMRGNQRELTPAQKSALCHVNTPIVFVSFL